LAARLVAEPVVLELAAPHSFPAALEEDSAAIPAALGDSAYLVVLLEERSGFVRFQEDA